MPASFSSFRFTLRKSKLMDPSLTVKLLSLSDALLNVPLPTPTTKLVDACLPRKKRVPSCERHKQSSKKSFSLSPSIDGTKILCLRLLACLLSTPYFRKKKQNTQSIIPNLRSPYFCSSQYLESSILPSGSIHLSSIAATVTWSFPIINDSHPNRPIPPT